jgi:molybdate transport system substrate-binding protein
VTVYAATSLTGAIEEAARICADSLGVKVTTRFGASGTLASLIAEGAPADVFISADAVWIDHLQSKDLLVAGSARILAWNRLVVVVPADTDSIPGAPVELVRAGRIALGNPEFVPVGRYAKQALEHLGVWDLVEAKVTFAQDARAVLAMAEEGQADAAVVYESDALASGRVLLAFLLPESSHDPVAYPGALLRDGKQSKNTLRFLEFLSSSRGRAIFLAHGLGAS